MWGRASDEGQQPKKEEGVGEGVDGRRRGRGCGRRVCGSGSGQEGARVSVSEQERYFSLLVIAVRRAVSFISVVCRRLRGS